MTAPLLLNAGGPDVTLLCIGASSETHAKNRQELYEVSKALEQAAKKRAATGAGKLGKKSPSVKQKAKSKAGGPADMNVSHSNMLQSESGVSKKKRKTVPASAKGQASGSVESPGEPAPPNTVAACGI